MKDNPLTAIYHRELVVANRSVARLSTRNKQLRKRVKELNEENDQLLQALKPWPGLILMLDYARKVFAKKDKRNGQVQEAPPVPEVRQQG